MTSSFSRRSLLGLGGAGLLAALTGCSLGSGVSDANAKKSGPLQYWTVSGGARLQLERDLVKAFNDGSPKNLVEVKNGGSSYANLGNKVLTTFRSGKAPDVVSLSEVWWPRLALTKVIQPIDDLLADQKIVRTDFVETLWDNYYYRDRQWGLPYVLSVPMLYANAEALDRSGVSRASLATWEGFAAAAPALSAALDGKPMYAVWKPGLDWIYQGLLWQKGGSISSGDFELQLTSDAAIAAAEQMRDWVRGSSKIGYLTAGDSLIDLQNRQAVVALQTSSGIVQKATAAKFPVAGLPFPGSAGPGGGAGLMMIAGASRQRQEEIAEFLAFMASATAASYAVEKLGGLPYRKDVALSDTVATLRAQVPAVGAAIDYLPTIRRSDLAYTFIPGTQTVLNDALTKVMLQDADIAATLASAQDQIHRNSLNQVKPQL